MEQAKQGGAACNKAPPPEAPAPQVRMIEPPTNLIETPSDESPTEEVRVSESDESSAISGEEEHGGIQPGPIVITRPERVRGPHVRLKFGISEMMDELGRGRYLAKQRISQTVKIIWGRAKLNQIIRDMIHGQKKEKRMAYEGPKKSTAE